MKDKLGYIFTELCIGTTKTNIAKSLQMNKMVLGRNIKKFSLDDRKTHIEIIIKELKKYEDSLK
jgi:hypothetical protein